MTVEAGPRHLTTAQLPPLTGQVLGCSGWHVVAQADANAFGAATRDEQWIHVDPQRAAHGPFGRTIAHGYLTLALATSLVDEVRDLAKPCCVADVLLRYYTKTAL